MRLRLVLLALALAGAATAGGEAAACTVTIDAGTFGEDGLSEAERERRRIASERRLLERQIGGRRAAAEAALITGADAPRALAEMLVPNVRPVFIEQGYCLGPPNEIDRGAGVETARDWLAGTRFEGREVEFRRILRDVDDALPGTPCNAEFRDWFADHLRRGMTARQLRGAYLFLGARWPSLDRSWAVTRFTAFAGNARRPPVHWVSPEPRLHASILRWARRDATGWAVQRAMDDFWRDNAPLFGDYARICPVAETEWRGTRARLVAALEAEEARREAAGSAPLM